MSRVNKRGLEIKQRGRPKGVGAAVVFDALRARIISLTLKPGVDIDETTLVDEFGVSRTPVREALIKLAADGLVEMLPNRGARVATLDFSDIPHYFEALALFQCATTRWAAIRATTESVKTIREAAEAFEAASLKDNALTMIERNRDFHAAIATSAGNPYVIQTNLRLLDEGLRLARLSYMHESPDLDKRTEHIARTVKEHELMVNLISKRDSAAAENLALDHTHHFRDRIMVYLQGNLLPGVAISEPVISE